MPGSLAAKRLKSMERWADLPIDEMPWEIKWEVPRAKRAHARWMADATDAEISPLTVARAAGEQLPPTNLPIENMPQEKDKETPEVFCKDAGWKPAGASAELVPLIVVPPAVVQAAEEWPQFMYQFEVPRCNYCCLPLHRMQGSVEIHDCCCFHVQRNNMHGCGMRDRHQCWAYFV